MSKKIIISESIDFICLTICCDDERSLGWEEIQTIKDDFFPGLDFIEVYPTKSEIINKANERHLIHQKGICIPKLGDLEQESEIKIIENYGDSRVQA